MKCGWVPGQEENEEPCGAEPFHSFGETLALCEEHCRYTYEGFEHHNRQLVWYLELREKFNGDHVSRNP